MNETVPFTLETSSGPLHGLVDLPDLPGERPTVVICHGFKGFMEWGFFPYLATLLAERGFVAVRFMRPSGEILTDLLAVLEAVGGTIAPGRVDRGRIGLFGHGSGGGNAILASARSPWRERLRALVTWASTTDLDVLAAAGTRRAPWLIVHGAENESVPVDEGQCLTEQASDEKELRVIPGATHTFGSRHPFAGPTPQLTQALNATQRWYRLHL